MRPTLVFGKKYRVLVSFAAVVGLTSVFVCLGTAAASYQTNPPINWPNGASYSKAINPFTAAGWGNQCTAFAWGRAHEVTGKQLPFRGNANTWYTTSSSLPKGSEPRANSIAVWEGDSTNTAGHVAYIENVVSDTVFFSEANILTSRSDGGYDGSIKQRSKSLLLNRGTGVGKLLGYLYLDAAPVTGVSPASLKTLAPNGGEKWAVGSTQTIRWSYSGDQANVGGGVRIEVIRGNDLAYTVPASIIIGRDGSGSFSWIIPSLPALPPESTYKVRVVSSTSVSDLSDQPFTLVGPRAVVSADLELKHGDAPTVNRPIRGTFTIANRGNANLVMNKVTIGGVVDGHCPEGCPDFPIYWRRTIRPGRTYTYTGSFVPRRTGMYTFSVAYQQTNNDWVKPVEAENGNINELQIDVREWKLFPPTPVKKGSALISWFNDDDKKKIPLILIHGIHGSDELPVITNKSPYWKSFISRFYGNAYLRRTYTLYAFQYYSNQEVVMDLATQLGKAVADKFPGRPHVLLAHSMGGLVAKSYMAEYPSAGESTLLLITLATPHHGTPGANDASAIKSYMPDGWYKVFNTINFAYWTDRAGFFSLPALNSGNPNRSDLRWDNYDGALTTDSNIWVNHINGKFTNYSAKVIAYAGALKPTVTELSPKRAAARILAAAIYNDHQRLEFANETMVYGLDWKFGVTDGLVPYRSALLCDKGTFLSAPDSGFFCPSPTRVRRFESGTTSVLSPQDNTLSINRRERGYDHLDMYEDKEVLDWVEKDLVLGPRPLVSTSLKFSPAANYFTGQPINGTFTITNRGRTDLIMKQVAIGGRLAGTCPKDQCPDFGPIPGNITLASGESYSYTGSFTPSLAGNYTFSVAYENTDGEWTMPVEAENGNKNKLNITVQGNGPNVVVSKSLTVAPGGGPYPLGQTLNGTFSITNRGNTSVSMKQVLIGGRVGNTCPNDVCPDFSPIPGNVTLAPGQTYDYSGRINLSQPGSYTFYVAYETPEGKWEMPVRPENGTRNTLSVLVQGPTPTITQVSPSSVGASTTAQPLTISGTRLSQIIYGELRLPNGSLSYLYIPLRQLVKVTNDQGRINAKFPVRGTYHLTVWSLEGKSNSYPITVY